MSSEPLAALALAMKESGMGKLAVAGLCSERFGKSKFSELTEMQQWALVCEIHPDAVGPYGTGMSPF
jgi:hypothetical protein